MKRAGGLVASRVLCRRYRTTSNHMAHTVSVLVWTISARSVMRSVPES